MLGRPRTYLGKSEREREIARQSSTCVCVCVHKSVCVCVGMCVGIKRAGGCWCADRSPLTEQPHRVAQSYAALRPKSESARSPISSACKAFQNLRHPAPADSKTLYDAQGFHHQGIDKSLQVGSTYRKKPIYIHIYIYTYIYRYTYIHIYIHIYISIHIYMFTYINIYRLEEPNSGKTKQRPQSLSS